jgi:hypothetical protein
VASGKKNAEELGAHLVFIDESGFLLIPPVRKTWAPKGCTPRILHHQKRDRLSVIGGLSVSPQRVRTSFFFDFLDHNIVGREVADFLRHLLRHLRGHVIVLWDRANIHRGVPVRTLCARSRRLHLEAFPPYAPELNPVEYVWSSLKNDTANSRPDDLFDLTDHVVGKMAELKLSQPHLRRCVHQAQLSLF